MIFVFDSNLAGHHMRGSAIKAVKFHGAIYGRGEGLQGESYAIPTKDRALQPLPIHQIEESVRRFLAFAASSQDQQFQLAPVGCEDGTYAPAEIAPLFQAAPQNIEMPYVFLSFFNGMDSRVGAPKLAMSEAVEKIDRLLAAMPTSAAKSEAMSVAMLLCFEELRSLEGDGFVADWLMAALKTIDRDNSSLEKMIDANHA